LGFNFRQFKSSEYFQKFSLNTFFAFSSVHFSDFEMSQFGSDFRCKNLKSERKNIHDCSNQSRFGTEPQRPVAMRWSG
ncbi:hypothetical protein ACSN7B_002369, partial [Flavobacterium psychrophilum]